MFSIPLLVLSFGILNIHAQECEDVKMDMSLTKSGRVELDVDQFCRCAGYSKTTDSPHLSKWKKKPTTDAVIVTVKPTKDKRSTFKDIDEVTAVLRRQTTKPVTDLITENTTVDMGIHKSSSEKNIVILPIGLTTEKATPITTPKTNTTTDTSAIDLTTKSAKDLITGKDVVDKSYIDKVIENSTSLMEEKVKDVPYKIEKSVVVNTTDEKTTDKSFISLTTKKDADMTIKKSTMGNATEKISTHEAIIKISIDLTTERATEKNLTDKSLDKAIANKTIVKSFIDLTTERSIDKVTGKNVTEKVVDKSKKERVTDTTFTSETRERVNVTDKPYHTNGTAPTTEKKMEKSTEAALGTSHMTKKSANRLQILLILLAIVVLAGFIFAVCYTVYMSRRSNSYVLPSPEDEATPLNNI